jgi:FkbM family methyltransferase
MKRRPNLIIDVGMHTGEDTARFLAKGFEVVAVEANPQLVEAASETFVEEIREGRLTIVNAAISDHRGTASFGIASPLTAWSTFDTELIARNELAGASYRYVDVETIPFGDILEQHGIPQYLKIDIEGYDMLCVRALRAYAEKPAYLSIESSVSIVRATADAVFDELAELWVLGYRRFRYVEQSREENEVPREDEWSGPPWRNAWTTLARAQALRAHHNLAGMGGRWVNTPAGRAFRFARRKLKRPVVWYDLEAALPPSDKTEA